MPTSLPENFCKLRFLKLGRWATYPADTELWHTEHTSHYFEEYFGVWKEILDICVFDKEYGNYMYVPESFVKKLHDRIREVTAHDPKGLEKILFKFYYEKAEAKKDIPKINPANLSVLTNEDLVEVYTRNRDAAHRIVVYDQFTWIAENYWVPLMDAILVSKLGLTKGSSEYTEALFALMKPREISTTLEEKRAVIQQALLVQERKATLENSAKQLAQEYGWMPVLAYGVSWDAAKYQKEIQSLFSQNSEHLAKELSELNDYTNLRDKNLQKIVDKYQLSSNDLQIFIDFGLAIDVRNEAEYVASVAGFHLLSLYDEMMKRLELSITELRTLCEDEIVACLRGEADARVILANKGRIRAWWLDGETKHRVNFSPEQGEEVFIFAESQQASPDTLSVNIPITKRGITASRGKNRGVVKLVPSPDDNYKVEQGDILIAYSTMVDNLPAMKKAGAFVTESGGLTCHAAVVAREFGVPCIVNYKNAMQDFKDGDVVDVDADKGTVIII